jgi:hypothetical protein
MWALKVYDFIGMCAVLLQEILLNIYKQAEELGNVDEFYNANAKLFFSFSYNKFLVVFFIKVWGSKFQFIILYEGHRMMGF